MIIATLVMSGLWEVNIHDRPGEFFGSIALAIAELFAELSLIFT